MGIALVRVWITLEDPCVKGSVSSIVLLAGGGAFRGGPSRQPLSHWRDMPFTSLLLFLSCPGH